MFYRRISSLAAVLAITTLPALAQPEFGDDSAGYPRDGECDDPRFENAQGGNGMANALLINHSFGDATDCKNLFEEGQIVERDVYGPRGYVFPAGTACSDVKFGDDSGQWTNDGECDDPRFQDVTGGMANELSLDDLRVDATDCRTLCNDGSIEPRTRLTY